MLTYQGYFEIDALSLHESMEMFCSKAFSHRRDVSVCQWNIQYYTTHNPLGRFLSHTRGRQCRRGRKGKNERVKHYETQCEGGDVDRVIDTISYKKYVTQHYK